MPTYLDFAYLFRFRLMATETVDLHFLSLVVDSSECGQCPPYKFLSQTNAK